MIATALAASVASLGALSEVDPVSVQRLETVEPQVNLEAEQWVSQVQNRIEPEAVEWAKSQQKLSKAAFRDLLVQENSACSRCISVEVQSDEYSICVLVSLSMPVSSLLALSEEVSQVGGCFVLRGIPENSWSLLASKLIELDELGVNVPILIDPRLFEEWKVSQVPAFIVREEEGYDKVSGNISLETALRIMSEIEEAKGARELLEKYIGYFH
jgi:conjugal transfer pilus assembly protein TrbC